MRKIDTKISKTGRSYDESVKKKIVQEIHSGFLSHRSAAKKYGLNRKTIDSWVTDLCHTNLGPLKYAAELMDKSESFPAKLLAKQVHDLTKELEKAKLKINSLETMIEVCQTDLQINIRKKPGTKQSKE